MVPLALRTASLLLALLLWCNQPQEHRFRTRTTSRLQHLNKEGRCSLSLLLNQAAQLLNIRQPHLQLSQLSNRLSQLPRLPPRQLSLQLPPQLNQPNNQLNQRPRLLPPLLNLRSQLSQLQRLQQHPLNLPSQLSQPQLRLKLRSQHKQPNQVAQPLPSLFQPLLLLNNQLNSLQLLQPSNQPNQLSSLQLLQLNQLNSQPLPQPLSQRQLLLQLNNLQQKKRRKKRRRRRDSLFLERRTRMIRRTTRRKTKREILVRAVSQQPPQLNQLSNQLNNQPNSLLNSQLSNQLRLLSQQLPNHCQLLNPRSSPTKRSHSSNKSSLRSQLAVLEWVEASWPSWPLNKLKPLPRQLEHPRPQLPLLNQLSNQPNNQLSSLPQPLPRPLLHQLSLLQPALLPNPRLPLHHHQSPSLHHRQELVAPLW
mmetsp:Transcript_3531/g.4864  ORF Transcript_3531/g.4864 Transcript_3531/m.4864 type:complete len:421 (-) Transcript_3531:42-1304(-)